MRRVCGSHAVVGQERTSDGLADGVVAEPVLLMFQTVEVHAQVIAVATQPLGTVQHDVTQLALSLIHI